MKTVQLTARDHELLRMQPIAISMPIQFKNNAVWTNLQCFCSGCKHELAEETIRGAIVHHSEHMASVEAVGVCADCKLLTRFVFRLYDDMSMASPANGKWRWHRPPKNGTIWQKALKWIRNL